MLGKRLIVRLMLLFTFIVAAVGSVTPFRAIRPGEPFLSTTSPQRTYTVRLTGQQDRPRVPFVEHLCLAASAKAQGWRGIRPLHSTREDVERLIGPSMQPKGITYDLKNERVNVVYSAAGCAKGWPYGWNVKPGTVLGITIYPQPRPKLAELGIDISKSRKYVDPTGVIHYNNDDEGLSVAVDPNEYEVRVIEYYPAASDAHLRCPEATAREREIARGESAERAPDVIYSELSPEKKHVYLDYFADQLQKAPADSTVYIISYAGQRAKVGEAKAAANRAKHYLTQKRGIDPKRIVIINGGHRDPAGVELYITPRGQPKPLASPNVYPGNVQIIKDRNVSNNRLRRLRQHHSLTIKNLGCEH